MEVDDNKYMQRAIKLARSGLGQVSPNPPVGAVIVNNNKIIGEGYHQSYGGPHAEVNALKDVVPDSSTLYVTLEPCNHQGKTPPCTALILKKHIRRVVVGSIDPNPIMSGKSIKLLSKSGVKVDVGISKDSTDDLIRWYSHWSKTGRPYVTCKLALTGDNYYAPDNRSSTWISSQTSRSDVHKLRAEYDAVMVGTNTVVTDNPSLTVRSVRGRNPNRVVLDRFARIPGKAKLFNQNNSHIFYFSTVANNSLGAHVQQILYPEHDFSLLAILNSLGKQMQTSLLVEGGGLLIQSLINQNLCEEVILYKGGPSFETGLPFHTSMLDHNHFSLIHQSESGVDTKYIYRRPHV